MKPTTVLAALAAFALPAVSYAAPVRHPAVKKPVHHTVAAAKTATAAITATAAKSVVTAPASVQPTTGQPAGSRPFSDVPPDHWAAAAVETLRQRGIVNGYPAGTYRKK